MTREDNIAPHPNLAGDMSLGLPYDLAEEINEDNLGAPLSWLGSWLFMLIMCLGFVIVWLFLWPAGEAYDEHRALKTASELEGIAYNTNFGISLVIGVFIWIVATSTCVSIIIRLAPKRVKATLYLSGRSDFIGQTPRFFGLHKVWLAGTEIQTGEDYINAIAEKMISWTGRVVPFLTAIALFFFWRETSWNETFTEEAFIDKSFWTGAPSTHLWSDADEIELGCNFIKANSSRYSGPAKYHIIYDIKWENGTDVRLPIENQINGKNWLDNLETIDSAVRSGNAVFQRWKWRDRDPLHPKCISHFRTELGPKNKERLEALLRIGELD